MHQQRVLLTCVCRFRACHIGTQARQQAAREMNARCRMVASSLRGAWRPARIGRTYAAAMAAHSSQGLHPIECGRGLGDRSSSDQRRRCNVNICNTGGERSYWQIMPCIYLLEWFAARTTSTLEGHRMPGEVPRMACNNLSRNVLSTAERSAKYEY